MAAIQTLQEQLINILCSNSNGHFASACPRATDKDCDQRPCLLCILADHPLALKVIYTIIHKNRNPDSRWEVEYVPSKCTFVAYCPSEEDNSDSAAMLGFYRALDNTAAVSDISFPLILSKYIAPNKRTLITAMPRKYTSQLQEMVKTANWQSRAGALCHVWIRPPHNSISTQSQIGLPFQIGPVCMEYAEYINSKWTYGGTPQSLQLIKELIRLGRTTCIYSRDGTPVCWALQQIYGAIGMLHTEPSFRRLGFATAVVDKLARNIYENGELPFAYITDDNIASQLLFRRLGFLAAAESDWWNVITRSDP